MTSAKTINPKMTCTENADQTEGFRVAFKFVSIFPNQIQSDRALAA